MSGITTLGSPSKTVYLNREADRISLEFVVATGQTLKKGQPVKLAADGTVTIWGAADGITKLVGYCYQDAVAGDFVTIFTRGFAVIYAIAGAGGVIPGLGKYSSYDTTTSVATTGSGNANTTGYSVYLNVADVAGDTDANGWILDVAAAGVLIRVLLKN